MNYNNKANSRKYNTKLPEEKVKYQYRIKRNTPQIQNNINNNKNDKSK